MGVNAGTDGCDKKGSAGTGGNKERRATKRHAPWRARMPSEEEFTEGDSDKWESAREGEESKDSDEMKC